MLYCIKLGTPIATQPKGGFMPLNYMKKSILKMSALTLFVCLTNISAIYAAGGSGSDNAGGANGGGGSDVVAGFVDRARALIARIENASQKQINILVLKNTLSSAKIVPVVVLKDPVTQNPIADQEDLLAYGSPGLIQLKISSWRDAFTKNSPVDHHIIHELLRASGQYNDEGYRISIVILQLGPPKCLIVSWGFGDSYQIWIGKKVADEFHGLFSRRTELWGKTKEKVKELQEIGLCVGVEMKDSGTFLYETTNGRMGRP